MPEEGVPTDLIRAIIEEWVGQYGPTFPLYGEETDRQDISGSVRPLLTSTALKHEALLSERSGISRRHIKKIMKGELTTISFDMADAIVTAMDRADVWYNELAHCYAQV